MMLRWLTPEALLSVGDGVDGGDGRMAYSSVSHSSGKLNVLPFRIS
jgi:hypothetical protein